MVEVAEKAKRGRPRKDASPAQVKPKAAKAAVAKTSDSAVVKETAAKTTKTKSITGKAGRPRKDPPNIDAAAVSLRAHEIWEAEGRPHGKDQDHWHQAVKDVSGKKSA